MCVQCDGSKTRKKKTKRKYLPQYEIEILATYFMRSIYYIEGRHARNTRHLSEVHALRAQREAQTFIYVVVVRFVVSHTHTRPQRWTKSENYSRLENKNEQCVNADRWLLRGPPKRKWVSYTKHLAQKNIIVIGQMFWIVLADPTLVRACIITIICQSNSTTTSLDCVTHENIRRSFHRQTMFPSVISLSNLEPASMNINHSNNKNNGYEPQQFFVCA